MKQYLTKKDILEILPKNSWNVFQRFMRGQTVSINDQNETLFYKQDVERFIKSDQRIGKLE